MKWDSGAHGWRKQTELSSIFGEWESDRCQHQLVRGAVVLRALMSAYFSQKKPKEVLHAAPTCQLSRKLAYKVFTLEAWCNGKVQIRTSGIKKYIYIQRFYFGASEVCVGSHKYII